MNTILNAKNSFQDGMLLDFSPTNTQATCLTSALNATLITNNGNEMSLQNDMGNGRVETAYLPDGYVPVGTCEYGDIIYIISYNPLIDKAQIGCFPSPERNISTEELSDLEVVLTASDFQEFNDKNQPTGKLKTMSIKKELTQFNLQAGDKFIIASSDIDQQASSISAFGAKSCNNDDFPQLVKIHVVSVADDGKITYLDSSVKWYDRTEATPYFVATLKNDQTVPDIDSYRTMLSSGYSVYSSKVSGKLALLIELETISGFNCSWDIYKVGETQIKLDQNGNILNNDQVQSEDVATHTVIKSDYLVDLFVSWTTDNPDVNPSGIYFKSQYQTKENCSIWRLNDSNVAEKYNLSIKNLITTSIFDNIKKEKELLQNNYYDFTYSKKQNYDDWKKSNYYKELEYFKDVIKINYYYKTTEEIKKEGDGETYYETVTHNFSYPMIDGETGRFLFVDQDENNVNTSERTLYDNIINNYYKKPIPIRVGKFSLYTDTICKMTKNVLKKKAENEGEQDEYEEIVVSEKKLNNDLTKAVYEFDVIPYMKYGFLDHLKVHNIIDFSKVGKEYINLNTWKYYNQSTNSTLIWGFEMYTNPNEIVSNVVFNFYNNSKHCHTIEHKDFPSYNGQFTDHIIISNDENQTEGITSKNPLYLVEIIIHYKYKNSGISKDTVTKFYRWFWSNDVFNNNFTITNDFDLLNPSICQQFSVNFNATNLGKAFKAKLHNNYWQQQYTSNITLELRKLDSYFDYDDYDYEVYVNNEDMTTEAMCEDQPNITIKYIDEKKDKFSVDRKIFDVYNEGGTTVTTKETISEEPIPEESTTEEGKESDLFEYVNRDGKRVNLSVQVNKHKSIQDFTLQFDKPIRSYFQAEIDTGGKELPVYNSYIYNDSNLGEYNLQKFDSGINFVFYEFAGMYNVEDEGKDKKDHWSSQQGYFKRTSNGTGWASRARWSSWMSRKSVMFKDTYGYFDILGELPYIVEGNFVPFVMGFSDAQISEDKVKYLANSYTGTDKLVVDYKLSGYKKWGSAQSNKLDKQGTFGDDKWVCLIFKTPGNVITNNVMHHKECLNQYVTLLDSLYYKTTETKLIGGSSVKNVAYLSEFYFVYVSDVIVRITNSKENPNIKINGNYIEQLINNILKVAGIEESEKESINLNNTIFNILPFVCNFPLKIRIPYYQQKDDVDDYVGIIEGDVIDNSMEGYVRNRRNKNGKPVKFNSESMEGTTSNNFYFLSRDNVLISNNNNGLAGNAQVCDLYDWTSKDPEDTGKSLQIKDALLKSLKNANNKLIIGSKIDSTAKSNEDIHMTNTAGGTYNTGIRFPNHDFLVTI